METLTVTGPSRTSVCMAAGHLDPHPDGPAVPDLVEASEDSPRARPKGQFVVAGERQTVLEQVERDGGKELNERFDPRLEG